jgi:hypothetical protein
MDRQGEKPVFCLYRGIPMKSPPGTQQNLTIRLDRRTLRKAKLLAARRNLSMSRLVALYIEALVGEDEAYERAHRQALALLDEGFHLGGQIKATRGHWHAR